MGPRSTAAVKKALEALQEPRETGAGQAWAPRQKRAVAPGQEAPLASLACALDEHVVRQATKGKSSV